MSKDRNFTFPAYINKYYNDPVYRKVADAIYAVIHTGEFSAKELHEAVTLAENKEIMYGRRVMPTVKIEPMPGDRPNPAESRPVEDPYYWAENPPNRTRSTF